MHFARSTTHEFLVLGRRGTLRNLGRAAHVLLLPGDTCVRVGGAKHEAPFAMTQESQDGIPLRFKGLVVYRVVDPVAAAAAFDFTSGAGHAQIQEMIAHVCLGELRDVVSHSTMQSCVEGRRSTLSAAVAKALAEVVLGRGDGEGEPWGIELDLVQVSQVYIVDDELRRRLETELRNEVVARAEQSDLRMQESMELARIASRQRIARDSRDQEREQIESETEIELARRAAQRRIEAQELADERESHQNTLERLALQQERLPHRIAAQRGLMELRTLEEEAAILPDRLRAELEQQTLPQRQVPEVAHALAGVFQGADLSVYGADGLLDRHLAPLVDLLTTQLSRKGE